METRKRRPSVTFDLWARAPAALVVLALVLFSLVPLALRDTTHTSSTEVTPTRHHTSLTQSESVPSYWLAAADGGVFSFGGLPFEGSMGGKHLNKPIVGIAATPDGGGYWLVASDGGVFTFGDAQFYGSTGNLVLNQPVVGMAPTPDGRGYWLVAADGGIFSFGDAQFYGSTGAMALNKPIVAMAATPDGGGYWLVASDGGVFTFGDAPFEGSLGDDPLTFSEVSAASTGVVGNNGYWMVNSNGAVSSFGSAGNFGSAPQHLNAPVVGIADGPGNGSVTDTAYPSGSFGYDVSNYQCSGPLPSGQTLTRRKQSSSRA